MNLLWRAAFVVAGIVIGSTTFALLRVVPFADVTAIVLSDMATLRGLAQGSDLTNLLARAAAAIADMDYKRAIEIYSTALERSSSDKDRSDLLRFRALAFDLGGQVGLAEADYTAAVEIGGVDLRALRERGAFYLHRNRLDQARVDFETGARLASDDASFAYYQGRVLSAKRQFAAAIAHYSRAITLDPKAATYWLWRGEAKVLSKDFREGIADYDKALELGGLVRNERRQLHGGRGHAYLQMQEFQRAVADFDASLALTERNSAVMRLRGEAFEALGELEKALADYQRALALRPNDTWLIEQVKRLRGD